MSFVCVSCSCTYTLAHTVDAVERQPFVGLLRLDQRQVLDRRQPAVLRKRERDRIERLRKRAHRVLLNRRNLVRLLRDGQRRTDLRRTTAVHHAVVLDERAHHTHRVVERALRLVDNHLVRATQERRDGARVGTLFDHQHPVARRAEADLAHDAGVPELVRRQVLKPRHDPPVGRDRNQLELGAAHPADGRQLVLEQQVVRLVVKAPLAHDQVRAGVLDLLDHALERLALVLLELAVLLHGANVQLVLRFRPRRLEGARQDRDARVADLARHLGVRHVLVDHHTVHECRVLERATHLAVDLDQLKVDVAAVQVGDAQHRVDRDARKLVGRFRDTG